MDLSSDEENSSKLANVTIHDDPYKAAEGTHALVICTEWDEFVVRKRSMALIFCVGAY